ncbi:MAG: translation initiation factor IF-2 [Paludibacteraceae bacterium]|nr:translation initiation factor IF-2 [Paludibacteraceae bacterium]
MAIKLSKICKDLNIGLATATDFINSLKIEGLGEVGLNTRIDYDLHLIMAKKFAPTVARQLEEEHERELKKSQQPAEQQEQPEEEKKEEQKPTEKAEDEKKAESEKEQQALEEVKTEEKKEEQPADTKPQQDVKAETAPEEQKEEQKEEQEQKPDDKTANEGKPADKEQEVKPEADGKPDEQKPDDKANNAEQEHHSADEGSEHAEHKKDKHERQGKHDKQEKRENEEKKEKLRKQEKDSSSKAQINEDDEDEVFRLKTNVSATAPKVIGKIDLDSINTNTRPKPKSKEQKQKERKERNVQQNNEAKAEGGGKRKRERIKKGHVDVNNPQEIKNATKNINKKKGKQQKVEVSDEEVERQLKETLARLSANRGKTAGAKHRKEKREHVRQQIEQQIEQENAESKVLKLTEFVTANELANMMNISVNQVIATCMQIGMMVSINQRLDAETINIVAEEFGFTTEYVSAEIVEAIGADEEVNDADLEPRCPIVTVMGHVDHGKTSLLDHIRNTNVIAGEAGGITQHIGAYNVKLKNGQRITFLDTPGHEAFTAMRARGAKITDIAIIIVAADDNVMPQTVEAIHHAQAAGVPMIFAINKIDKPGANPEKIKEELANMNCLVEDWGGKYQSQDISAKKGTGVFELLEKVLLEAELLDLKANPKRRAQGSVIESSLDKGRGYIATVLVQDGTLHIGDCILAGTCYGRVKAMFNERNQKVTEVRPGEPVLILGLNGAPQAGDNFNVMPTEQEAREIANKRMQLQRELDLRSRKHFGLEELGRRVALGDFKELNIIVKGDVDGSVEALSDSLIKLSTENIQVNVIHKAVGAISDSDILLAAASDAIICGFQVRPTATARKLAEKEDIDIRLYSIIYDAIEEIKSAMEGMLAPEYKEEVTGTLEILQTFKISKVGTIAGCIVREGKIKRGQKVRLIRDGIVVYTGELESLKRFKDDIKEAGTNQECGLNIKGYNDIHIGDLIESFEQIEVHKTL